MDYKAIDNRIISALREDYVKATLDEADAAANPYAQFARWFDEALTAGIAAPNAMTLATADASGAPDARVVLLKGFNGDGDGASPGAAHAQPGFVFYTNYTSRKGRELAENPRAALLFFWAEMERQVRVEGRISRVSDAESDEYFNSRPLGSRIGAIASPQSEVLPHRAQLEKAIADLTARHGQQPPRPAYWGGYRVTPHAMEFWQGRRDRVHDRLRYRLTSGPQGNAWIRERLAP